MSYRYEYRPINESLITAANYDLRQMKKRERGRGRHTNQRSFRRELANRAVLTESEGCPEKKRETKKRREKPGGRSNERITVRGWDEG